MSPILPKNELENSSFCPSLLGQKSFVRFLGELKKTKCPFEINWPLACVQKSNQSMILKVEKHILNSYLLFRIHASSYS